MTPTISLRQANISGLKIGHPIVGAMRNVFCERYRSCIAAPQEARKRCETLICARLHAEYSHGDESQWAEIAQMEGERRMKTDRETAVDGKILGTTWHLEPCY